MKFIDIDKVKCFVSDSHNTETRNVEVYNIVKGYEVYHNGERVKRLTHFKPERYDNMVYIVYYSDTPAVANDINADIPLELVQVTRTPLGTL